ncbi:uncharacterized protein [Salmo salar]|uniref:Uncharacterized protein n=1 Tax=Salmo salar TaxID=8030 RepID=A0A1S3S5N6_SALSA|nr:uncharacterized protein LOC106607322 [Salmo salar]|eukprot:XP_014059648.1 PREDICTED: uncharacterized protein LOC106607322 [Salmo salar]
MERNALLCIFFLLLPLALTSADIPVLNSIKDLRNIEFGHGFPRHGLMLLHFVSGGIYVDNNDALIPTFSPERGDWGFHYFNNNEHIFPPLQDQNNQGYYAVGNINTRTAYPLYPYVTHSYYLTPGNLERNMDRLVVRTHPNSLLLEAVYITQHYRGSNEYDPSNTYQISSALLREIRTLSNNRVDSVHAFLYAAGYDVDSTSFTQNCFATDSPYMVEDAGRMTLNESTAIMKGAVVNDHHTECYAVVLQVKSTESGYARLGWANVPDSLLDEGVMLALFINNAKNNLESLSLDKRSYGTYDTNQYLNHGLQVKLLSKDGSNVFMSGPKYDDADRKLPVGIEGYDASLQLYTKDGYACARLFISKTFTDWKTDFYYSWVGFYSNHNDASNSYSTHQYAIYFTKQDDTNIKYDIYSYVSDMSIQPGAQARFFLTETYDEILAQTKPWER